MSAVRRDRSDAGFTLTELLISLILLGIVLAAIYAATSAMLTASRQSEAQSVFSRDSGEPMRLMEKALMQNTKVTNSGAYTITIQTDRNMDALNEEIVITASSMRLRYQEWQLNSMGVRTTTNPRRDWYMSRACNNTARGIPLFLYWVPDADGAMDADGSAIYDQLPLADVPSQGVNARKVTIQLCLTSNKQNYMITRDVYFRNRE